MKHTTLWFLLLFSTASLRGQKAISVCDLLEHGGDQRGHMVTVKGNLHMGPEEFALYGVDCPFVLETKGYKWPTAVWLTPPGGVPEERVNFVVDKQAMEEFPRDVAKFYAANPAALYVPVVVVGKFEFPRKFVGGIGTNGRWVGNGYGHLNFYPGQIVIRLMRLDGPDGAKGKTP